MSSLKNSKVVLIKIANVVSKYGGQISEAAHQQTKKETRFEENSPEFISHKQDKIREIVRDSFGIISRPSDKWQMDGSYFFNRRSEMGFSNNKGHQMIAGMFGRELFELIYPNWWGGQGKSSEASPTEKVNNKPYESGSNFARMIPHPGWANSIYASAQNNVNTNQQQSQFQDYRDEVIQTNIRPPTVHITIKHKIDPVILEAAGVPTQSMNYRIPHCPFDPSTYYSPQGVINGGGEPVYPTYKEHDFHPPAHIPQVRDPTLRSLYPQNSATNR